MSYYANRIAACPRHQNAALHMAAANGHEEIVSILLDANAVRHFWLHPCSTTRASSSFSAAGMMAARQLFDQLPLLSTAPDVLHTQLTG
jgi:ankyrin repeat protein